MTIVYVVTEFDNGMGSGHVHIASSEQAAAEWISKHPSYYGDGSYSIDQWELDKDYVTASAIAAIESRVQPNETEIRS